MSLNNVLVKYSNGKIVEEILTAEMLERLQQRKDIRILGIMENMFDESTEKSN